MTVQLLNDYDMSTNYESDYLAVSNLPYPGRTYNISGIQISWKNVTGSRNGILKLMASYDKEANSFLKSFIIDCESNLNDALFVVCLPYFEYLKIEYEKNEIISGLLSIAISYTNEKGN